MIFVACFPTAGRSNNSCGTLEHSNETNGVRRSLTESVLCWHCQKTYEKIGQKQAAKILVNRYRPRPPSATYRIRQFARKHKGSLAAATGFILLLIAGTVASTNEAMRANRRARPSMRIPSELALLTDRERACLRCLAQGMSTHDIVEELGIGLTTVHTHLRRTREKLGSISAEALIGFAARYFFVSPPSAMGEPVASRKRCV
jgi:DNA-binding CsgD family transcriptional regulator